MAAVRNLANQNRTVVCTIHQPSIEVRDGPPPSRHLSPHPHRTLLPTNLINSHRPTKPQVFALFDKLILLAPVGEQVYYGSTHEAVKYFSSPALDFEFHKGANPAEFVMSASQVRAAPCLRMCACIDR